MFFAKDASPLFATALVRYLLLCTAQRKKCGKTEDPDGEFLE